MMMMLRILLCLFLVFGTSAAASAESGDLRFALGYAFLSQADEIKDTLKRLSRDNGKGHDIYSIFPSLSFQPYYQLGKGWRAGIGIGPMMILSGDAHHYQCPLNITLGRSFLTGTDFSPYFRAGISYHAATGDYDADADPGFYGGLGMEWLYSPSTHVGFEAAWDGAMISFDPRPGETRHQKIRTGELTFFLYADF